MLRTVGIHMTPSKDYADVSFANPKWCVIHGSEIFHVGYYRARSAAQIVYLRYNNSTWDVFIDVELNESFLDSDN